MKTLDFAAPRPHPGVLSMDRIAFLLLVLCNLAWSVNGLAGKSLLEAFSGIQVGWMRYAGAFSAFLLYAASGVLFRRRRWTDYFLIPRRAEVARDLAILGVGPFALSPVFQFIGLKTVQAMDYSILIAVEPLVTVWMAWIVLGERMKRIHFVAMGIALFGFLLFSGIFRTGISGFPFGMLFLLGALVAECAHSVFGKKLVAEFEPRRFLGSALGIGAVLLTVFTAATDGIPDLTRIQTRGQWASALWIGPIASTCTYIVWSAVSKRVAVATMSITLFIQPVAGAALGYLFRDEGLDLERAVGAFLILAAIASLSLQELRSGNSPPA
jgi:chloramphenicol-sensitive protein RarD